jgi:hypothetical protein
LSEASISGGVGFEPFLVTGWAPFPLSWDSLSLDSNSLILWSRASSAAGFCKDFSSSSRILFIKASVASLCAACWELITWMAAWRYIGMDMIYMKLLGNNFDIYEIKDVYHSNMENTFKENVPGYIYV